MPDQPSLKRVLDLLVAERAAKAQETKILDDARAEIRPLAAHLLNDLREEVLEAGNSGNIDLILGIEKRLLADELEHSDAAGAHRTSIENSLRDITAAQAMLPEVRDPSAYQNVDRLHNVEKRRDLKGTVPLDDARQFLKSHIDRIKLTVRAFGHGDTTDPRKRLLIVRRGNMSTALVLYTQLQCQALGLPRPGRTRSRELDIER